MKTIYLILLIAVSNIYGQVSKSWNKIEFTQVLNNEITKSELYFNNDESIYFFGNKSIIDTTSLNITIRKTDEIGNATYKNRNKKILFTRHADGKLVYKINDNIPVLNWKILEDTKTVATIILRKAITEFRGRKYIAWFDEDIANDSGPLKMGGLPGLILELSTEDNFLNITFNRVVRNSENPINLLNVINNYDKEMSQKEWVKESKEQIEAFIRKIKARETRGSVTNISVGESLERKYEWEN
jgi:GLPGLI family protein